MTKVAPAIAHLHEAERELAAELRRVSARHRADAGVAVMAETLARWSDRHCEALADLGRQQDLDLEAAAPAEGAVVQSAQHVGTLSPDTLPSILADLRILHMLAAGVSIDWVALAQAAQAQRDETMLGVVQDCHPDTLRQLRWANAMVKELAAQALTAS